MSEASCDRPQFESPVRVSRCAAQATKKFDSRELSLLWDATELAWQIGNVGSHRPLRADIVSYDLRHLMRNVLPWLAD